MTEPNDLLAAVDALTLPEHTAQKTDEGKWLKAITAPPLLERMREAVMPSSNTTSGSASTASTRSPADLDAMHQYATITAQIWDWCRIANLEPIFPRDAVRDLRRWYTTTLTVPVDDMFYRRQLRAWAGIIRNHLDPPETFVIEHPCPICGTTGYGNEIDGGDRYPIEVRYRMSDDRMTEPTATCRVCTTRWEGHEAVMELAEELNEKGSADV